VDGRDVPAAPAQKPSTVNRTGSAVAEAET
jgi:hypothetical protein